MKTGQTIEFIVLNKNGEIVDNAFAYYQGNDPAAHHWAHNITHKVMTRKTARAFKNFLNVNSPHLAPFRIAQTIITK